MNSMNLFGGFFLIFSAVFFCGWKVGNYFGWREGFRIAKAIERQRVEMGWRTGQTGDSGDGTWDYSPKIKGAANSVRNPSDDNKQK